MMPVPFKNTAQGNRVYLEGALYFVLKGRVQCLGGRGLKKFSRVTHSAKLLDPPLVAAVHFLNIQSKRFVALMNEVVAYMMIVFSTMFRSLLPNRSKLHSTSESNLFMSKPGIVSWRKRSLRIRSNWWQCRRKCLLSSMPLPHIQVGLLQSKLCRNLCSFRALKFTRSFVSFLIPSIQRHHKQCL